MSKPFSLRYAALILLSAMTLSSGAALAQSAFDDPGSRTATGATGGDLKAVTDKVDAGEVALGSTAQVVILFRNDDAKPIKTGVINLYPSSNITAAVGENQCIAAAIAPGEVCAISLTVKGLQAGNYRIEMLMRHDGRAKLLTTTVNGSVKSNGEENRDLISELEAIPNTVDFGSLDESRSQAKAVILRNKTSKPIQIDSLEIEAGIQSGYSVTSNCKELAAGAACVASVTWTPVQRGPSTGTLIVHHSGATEINTVDVKGEYTPEDTEKAEIFPQAVPGRGLLVSSQEDVDFGSSVSESSSITVSLVNTGDVPLTLNGIRMTNTENGVRAEKTGCRVGTVLSPLEACPLTLTWEPVREGSIVDDVQILHNGARGVLVLPLRGAASKAINKDRKAIMLSGDPGAEAIINNIRPLSLDDIEDNGETVIENGEKATVAKEPAKAGTASKKSAKSPKTSETSDSADEAAAPASSPRRPVAAEQDEIDAAEFMQKRASQIDVRGTLDGYTISSFSPKRAIIAGPGGSRVVFDGEQAVIGGVLWDIRMRPSAIEFRSGSQKVLLLFDRSLSSVNLLDAQSSNSSMSSSGSSSTTSSTTSSGTQ